MIMPMSMDMLQGHGHAALHGHGHAAWTCSMYMDKQHGHAACTWISSMYMAMQYGDMDIGCYWSSELGCNYVKIHNYVNFDLIITTFE